MPDRSEFDLTLAFSFLSGPFKAHLTVADDFIEVRPGPRWLASRFGMFRSKQVDSAEVTVVREDALPRRGLRIGTVSGALDRFVLVPLSPVERARVHAAMRDHGYTVG